MAASILVIGSKRSTKMAYDNLEHEHLILRDHLAAERTHLANERTLLAYLRSALIFLGSSLTLFKLFEHDLLMFIIAIALIPVSIFVALFGIYRFRAVRKKLAIFNSKSKVEIKNESK